jgi:uncharacterized SAM-binding protein YcdF (DUF218 family)
MRAVATWAAGVAALWAAGLLWFVLDAPPPDASAAPTDAIVVLTGGSLRLESGFDQLRQGRGRMLFVSGVNPHVGLADLLHVLGNIPDWAACCVVLGHAAETTSGNAIETAEWMQQHGYRSLRLVTAWYHMPRSLLEFERAMPRIAITPHPVFPEGIAPARWWRSRGATGVLIAEYDKYLAALLRPLGATLRREFEPQPR